MKRNNHITPLGWLLLIVILGIAFYQSEVWKPKKTSEYNINRASLVTERPTPRPTATPIPFNAYNGQMFKKSDYETKCPFTIEAPQGSNYYVYLQYKYAPINSTINRKAHGSSTSPYENDIAFYLKSGQSVDIDVPVGTYKLFYAVGETFFGEKLLFGDRTKYYSSEDLLTFYTDDQYCHGHTVTLKTVVNGNFDTDPIFESQFPGR